MLSIEELDKRAAELQAELEIIKKSRFETLNQLKTMPYVELADNLHSIMCHWNHADGCAWYYEIKNNVHDWNGREHQRYLCIAQKLIQQTNYTAAQLNGVAKKMLELKKS